MTTRKQKIEALVGEAFPPYPELNDYLAVFPEKEARERYWNAHVAHEEFISDVLSAYFRRRYENMTPRQLKQLHERYQKRDRWIAPEQALNLAADEAQARYSDRGGDWTIAVERQLSWEYNQLETREINQLYAWLQALPITLKQNLAAALEQRQSA